MKRPDIARAGKKTKQMEPDSPPRSIRIGTHERPLEKEGGPTGFDKAELSP